jgi:uncharacterized iron-regulated protein
MKAPATVSVLLCAAVAAGCGGPAKTARMPRGVESAGLPYRFVDARTGREIPEADAWTRLAASRAICVGEMHPNPHHHWAQMRIVEELAGRARADGRALALGMEMFQRPYQGVLDDFAAGRIDEAALLSRSGWKERWGYDFALYRPIIARALAAGAALIALNPAKELVKKVSRQGIDKMTPAERAQLPELVLDDAAHRAWWDDIMGGMGASHGHGDRGGDDDGEPAPPPTPEEAAEAKAKDERIYTAQVTWDESMADGAARWVGGGEGRAMILLAGNGHCHDSAVVSRIKRRGVADAVSVLPIIDDGENVAAELAKPANDFLFVMTMPANLAPR